MWVNEMNKKVLIAGGAGFIGYHLARRLLEDGYHVDLIDNLTRGVYDSECRELIDQFDKARFLNLDLLNPDIKTTLPRDYSYIFSMAAIVGVEHVMKSPYRVLVDNLNLLDNLIRVAQKQEGLSRFLYPSTSEVYAGTLENFHLPIPTPENIGLSTTDLKRPRTSYMLSKIVGESLCHYADIPYTIFRPHNIYGPRMGLAHVIPGQLQKAYYASDGDAVAVASPEHTRCFCYIDDAIEQLIRMMCSSDAVGETLNLGTESPEVTMLEVAKLCHQVVGRNLPIRKEKPTSGSPERRCPDMAKSFSITGYASQTDLLKGIEKTFHWYEENIFNGSMDVAK